MTCYFSKSPFTNPMDRLSPSIPFGHLSPMDPLTPFGHLSPMDPLTPFGQLSLLDPLILSGSTPETIKMLEVSPSLPSSP